MQKPASPSEWDVASPRDRRIGKVPAQRPTQEEYEARLALWQAERQEERRVVDAWRPLVAAGGKYWSNDASTKQRVYFDDPGLPFSGYVDVMTGEVVATRGDSAAFRAFVAAAKVA